MSVRELIERGRKSLQTYEQPALTTAARKARADIFAYQVGGDLPRLLACLERAVDGLVDVARTDGGGMGFRCRETLAKLDRIAKGGEA